MTDKTTYYQINRVKILNRAKQYYENNKERSREQAKNKYRELSNEDKDIKREYGRSRYQNMFKENKRKLKEYHKNYREAKKEWNQMYQLLTRKVLLEICFIN